MSLLWFLIIGLIAGWAAGKVIKGRGQGLVLDLVVGVVGAVIGGWLFGQLHVFPGYGLIGQLVVAFIGAVILLLIVGLVRKA